MKLIKFLGFCAFWYLVYEFVQGLVSGSGRAPQETGERSVAGSSDLHRALNEGQGRMNVTGPGHGRTVETQDFQGGQSKHVVGRGVVQR